MKPLSEKSYVDQALKNGKGITWLDDCRIPYESLNDYESCDIKQKSFSGAKSIGTVNKGGETFLGGDIYQPPPFASDFQKGRFPANLLVSDDVLNDGVSGKSVGHNPNIKTIGYGSFGGGTSERVDYKSDTYISDSGSFSRYFDLDKWYINKLPNDVKKTFPFLIVPKASSGEKNEGLDGFEEKKYRGSYNDSSMLGILDEIQNSPRDSHKNVHPTVKPTKLMSYLITLGSRENDLVLDPFIGSGTTAIAARLLSRDFVGFEKNKEYYDICVARIKQYMEQKKLGDFC